MRRMSLVGLLLLALAVPALAGGAGNLRLAQQLERVGSGETILYVQALQHDVHPRPDIMLSVAGSGPNGATFVGTGELDCTHGKEYVFAVPLPLNQPGEWRLELNATHHYISFPPLSLAVEVLPLGMAAPTPEPVKPFVALTHAHGIGISDYEAACPGSSATGAVSQVSATEEAGTQAGAILADAEASTGMPVILLGAAGAVTALAGLLLWRRRGKTQN